MINFKINRRLFFLICVSLIFLLGDFYKIIAIPKDLIKSPFFALQGEILKGYQNFRQDQRAELEERIRQLAVEQNQLSALREENEKLRRLLGMPLPRHWDYIDARPLGIVDRRLTISRGNEDGVEKGMMVIADGILVGKLAKIERHISLVELINSLSYGIPVVAKKPGGSGVQGRGILLKEGERLYLDRVLQSEDIQKGDLVVTSGLEGWLPELVIGEIEEIGGSKADVYKKALVKPLVDYQNLRLVFIVKPR